MKQNYERQEAAHAARKAPEPAAVETVPTLAAEIAAVEVIEHEAPIYEEQHD